MATWQDGPEYAPATPPDEYAVPDVKPLDSAPPADQLGDAPGARPVFGNPGEPVAPLATLIPDEGEDVRDPRSPFDVDSDTMTSSSGGAWGAAHWRQPAGQPVTAAGPWGPPTGTPAGLPTDPMQLRAGAPPTVGNLPAPGTPGWFGPGPSMPAPAGPPPSLWKATPPGAIIALALSVIFPIAPITFLIGLLLSARARYARRKIMIGFAVSTASMLLIATVSTIANYGDFSTWWDTLRGWALLGSLVMIVLILVLVNTELKNGQPPRPGPYGPGPYGRSPYDQGPDQQQQPPHHSW
ncbi:hypothetical protein FOE78_21330 [Microlunatus elymi]|uniref:Uncharacterized protein n=1 Tax=Microlunatus elymi TaxID=2596828 RepID=A0A516Q3T9_9ACTN|nr:hypothetical protein [Microlunatus elymi]QDP98103.1 hypothetical protein FOE78_21330 [Microlunatus elymi]